VTASSAANGRTGRRLALPSVAAILLDRPDASRGALCALACDAESALETAGQPWTIWAAEGRNRRGNLSAETDSSGSPPGRRARRRSSAAAQAERARRCAAGRRLDHLRELFGSLPATSGMFGRYLASGDAARHRCTATGPRRSFVLPPIQPRRRLRTRSGRQGPGFADSSPTPCWAQIDPVVDAAGTARVC
jgi:hypothetical protein